jgi:Bacterial extracellular solute-binding protein, family 7
VGPYDDLKLGFNKVAPNYYYPGWWEGGPQLTLYVNQKAYDGLSAEYKAIIESAAAYAHTDMQAKYDYRNPAALKTLVSQGVKLHPFPKDVMAGAFKAALEVYAELNASNPAWKKIYDDYSVVMPICGSALPKQDSTTSCSPRNWDKSWPARWPHKKPRLGGVFCWVTSRRVRVFWPDRSSGTPSAPSSDLLCLRQPQVPLLRPKKRRVLALALP